MLYEIYQEKEYIERAKITFEWMINIGKVVNLENGKVIDGFAEDK